jgi:peroxiredoxin
VFGVSSGNAQDKAKFIATTKISTLELLIDEADKVRTSWKVPRALFGKYSCSSLYLSYI